VSDFRFERDVDVMAHADDEIRFEIADDRHETVDAADDIVRCRRAVVDRVAGSFRPVYPP
jgi:hypothetical protein